MHIAGRNLTINGIGSIWIFPQAVQFLCGLLTSDVFSDEGIKCFLPLYVLKDVSFKVFMA